MGMCVWMCKYKNIKFSVDFCFALPVKERWRQITLKRGSDDKQKFGVVDFQDFDDIGDSFRLVPYCRSVMIESE